MKASQDELKILYPMSRGQKLVEFSYLQFQLESAGGADIVDSRVITPLQQKGIIELEAESGTVIYPREYKLSAKAIKLLAERPRIQKASGVHKKPRKR